MKFREFDVPLVPVDIGEWGIMIETDHGEIPLDTVYCRELTTAEFSELDRIRESYGGEGKQDHSLARLIVRFALDKDGQRVFTDDNLNQIASGSSKPCRRFSQALFASNHFKGTDAETLKKT